VRGGRIALGKVESARSEVGAIDRAVAKTACRRQIDWAPKATRFGNVPHPGRAARNVGSASPCIGARESGDAQLALRSLGRERRWARQADVGGTRVERTCPAPIGVAVAGPADLRDPLVST
jgi:hypothetical protein